MTSHTPGRRFLLSKRSLVLRADFGLPETGTCTSDSSRVWLHRKQTAKRPSKMWHGQHHTTLISECLGPETQNCVTWTEMNHSWHISAFQHREKIQVTLPSQLWKLIQTPLYCCQSAWIQKECEVNDLLHFPLYSFGPAGHTHILCKSIDSSVKKPGHNHTLHATCGTSQSFWLSLSRHYCMPCLQICSYTELGLTRFTGPNPTVSGLPSSSTLMALLTSPLQSCRAITHSSWFLPVMSISCREDTTTVSMFQTKKAPKSLRIS